MDQMRLVNYQNYPGIHVNKTSDTGTKIFDDNGNVALRILGKDDEGHVIATKYNLIKMTDVGDLKIPQLVSIEGMDGQEIHISPLTQELIGPSMFHAEDFNWTTIEKAINIVLKNQAIEDENMQSIVDYFNHFSHDNLIAIGHELSKIIAKDYATKDQYTKFSNDIERRMQNIEARFPKNPQPNGFFPRNYTGSDNSDDDPELEAKLQRMKNEMEGTD